MRLAHASWLSGVGGSSDARHHPAISFDVLLRAFRHGRPVEVDGEQVLDVLSRHAAGPVTRSTGSLRTSDGSARVFGLDDPSNGFVINRASGYAIWDALIDVAHVAEMAIVPDGCPTCVTRAVLIAHLPDTLRANTRIATTGMQVIEAFTPTRFASSRLI